MSFNLTQAIENVDAEVVRIIPNVEKVTNVKRKHLFDYGIAHKYKDWRDTLIRYYLYLPYADTIEIDNCKILGKVLSADCYFDIRTGNIKYYIFADDTLVDTVGGSVKIQLPVSSTDPMAKLDKIRDITRQNVSRNIVPVGLAIGGAMTGNPVALAGALGSSLVNTGLSYMSQPEKQQPISTHFNYNFSASTCVDDPLDIYLYTVEPNIDYDNGIRQNYGLPCNTYGTINGHTGYIQIEDLKLKGDIPEDDKAEILTELSKGFYLV